jgi:hypothetical protein
MVNSKEDKKEKTLMLWDILAAIFEAKNLMIKRDYSYIKCWTDVI